MKLLINIFRFYRDGFRSMTVGRQLWLLIAVKVLIFFGILKLFFFPDILGQKTPEGGDRGATARTEILKR